MAMYECPSVKMAISKSVPEVGKRMSLYKLNYSLTSGLELEKILTSTVQQIKTLDFEERTYAVKTRHTVYVVKVG